MSKNMIIALLIVVVILITGGLVSTIIFLPTSDVVTAIDNYTSLSQNDYKYTASKVIQQKEEDHQVTLGKVEDGIKNKDYIAGRENPFTPINQVNIYNDYNANKYGDDSYIDRGAGYYGTSNKVNNGTETINPDKPGSSGK